MRPLINAMGQLLCPYGKDIIRQEDKTCNCCGRIFMPMVSKNRTVLYYQEINNNLVIPLARITN